MRPAQDEAGDRILRPAELEAVGSPDGKVGRAARLERAEVVPAEHRRAAARPEAQRLAGGQRCGPVAAPRHEQRLLDLQPEVAALVRGRAVDAQPDRNRSVEERPHRGDARAEPQVRARAVRHTGRGLAEAPHVAVGEMNAVRAPDIAVEPAEPLEVLDRPAVVQLEAVRLLLGGLGEVGMEA